MVNFKLDRHLFHTIILIPQNEWSLFSQQVIINFKFALPQYYIKCLSSHNTEASLSYTYSECKSSQCCSFQNSLDIIHCQTNLLVLILIFFARTVKICQIFVIVACIEFQKVGTKSATALQQTAVLV